MFGHRPTGLAPNPPPTPPKRDATDEGGLRAGAKSGGPAPGNEPNAPRITKASRARQDQFNELKTRIHRKLVERLDLTAL